jgi:hypothetical protein
VISKVGHECRSADDWPDPRTYYVGNERCEGKTYSPLSLGDRVGTSTGDYSIDINVQVPQAICVGRQDGNYADGQRLK